MQSLLSQQQREIHLLTVRSTNIATCLAKSLSELEAKNSELEAQVMRWESTAQRALDENQFLREQLEHKSALLLRLEAQVGAIQEQVGGSTHFRTMLSTLNHELALWETCHNNTNNDKEEEQEAVMSQARQLETANNILNEQLHTLQTNHRALQSLYEQMKEKAERAELSRKEQTSLAQAQKQLLEYQKQITSQKIQALEDKYSTLKKAYLGLERHMVALESQHEKHRLRCLKVDGRDNTARGRSLTIPASSDTRCSTNPHPGEDGLT